MSRFVIVLALLGLLLGGTSLWIAADASAVQTAEVARLHDARAELEQSIRTLGRQVAELRDDLVEFGRTGSQVQRVVVATGDQQPEPTAVAAAGPDANDASLRHQSPSVDAKRKALEDLAASARSGDANALAQLLAGLDDPAPEVREKAVKMLGRLADPALLGHLRRAAADQDSDVRCAVAASLPKLPGGDAGPILIAMLHDLEPEVVEEAIKALAKLDYPEARPHLTSQLAAPDLDVAARAASALRGMGDERAAQPAIDRIMQDFARGDAKVRIRDVKWLRRIGGPTVIAQLRIIMDTDPSLSVREEARAALVRLGV